MREPTAPPTDVDRWFVQIKGQIVGPISSDKILDRLIKDEIEVTHRVSKDRKEWAAICNTPTFEDLIIHRIRIYSGDAESVGQMHPGGDDSQLEISQVFGLHGATDGISEQLDHARQLEELTASIQKLNFLKKEIVLKKKSVVHEAFDDTEDEVHPDDQNVFVPALRKSKSLSTRFRELLSSGGSQRQRRLAGFLSLICLIAAGSQGYFVYIDYRQAEQDKANLQQMLEAQAKGDYAKAVASFKNLKDKDFLKAGADKSVKAKDLIGLAQSHVKANDRKTAQMLLEQAMLMQPTTGDLAVLHSVRAQLAADSGDLAGATVEFENSLKHAEVFSTLHNLAILKLKMEKPAEAEPLLLRAIESASGLTNADMGPTVLAMFETALALDRIDGASFKGSPTPRRMRRLESSLELLDETLRKSTKFSELLRLAIAIGRHELGQREAFELSAHELMDAVPAEKPEDTGSILNRELATWTQFARYCTEIYSQPKPTDFVIAFYSACMTRSHGAAQALPYAQYALRMRPNDPVYSGLVAYLLHSLNQNNEARKLLVPNGELLRGSKLASKTIELIGLRAPTSAH